MERYRQEWRRTGSVLALLLLCVLTVSPACAGPAVMLGDDFARQAVGRHIDYLEDPDRNLGLAEILSPAFQERFTPSRHFQLDLGLSRSAWWLRLAVQNITDCP